MSKDARATWIFAASWAIRAYSIFDGGIMAWALVGWVGMWLAKKIWKRWKEKRHGRVSSD